MGRKVLFSSLFFVTLFIGCGGQDATTEENKVSDVQDTTKKIEEIEEVKIPTKQNNAAIALPNLTNSHMPTDNLDVK